LKVDPSELPQLECEADYFDYFDPRYHDGGLWIEEGMEWLREHGRKAGLINDSEITADAYNYLTETIGIEVRDVFKRWESVPVVFMPAHVSNQHGVTEKGSLFDLLDDAVRAFVAGAPAAAIAMCRAALELVLRRHYGRGKWDERDVKLGKLIDLTSQRYDHVDKGRLDRLSQRANGILHDYVGQRRLSKEDEGTILEFLKTLKFLIERAP
jgi:hypothetical protein